MTHGQLLNDDEIKKQSNEPIKLELSNTLNLVTVARVCKAKGYERMLYLAKYLKEANIDFKWFIIGGNYYIFTINIHIITSKIFNLIIITHPALVCQA